MILKYGNSKDDGYFIVKLHKQITVQKKRRQLTIAQEIKMTNQMIASIS